MKIVPLSEEDFVLYLKQSYLEEVDFDQRLELESYFKTLFSKLKSYYDIELCGYYHITCYVDLYYGMILVIHKEDVEYFDYLENQVDMRILMRDDSCFLYQIEDLFDLTDELKKKGAVYQYKNKFYYKLNRKINAIAFGKLLERSEIIYENTLQIIKYGKQVQIKF